MCNTVQRKKVDRKEKYSVLETYMRPPASFAAWAIMAASAFDPPHESLLKSFICLYPFIRMK